MFSHAMQASLPALLQPMLGVTLHTTDFPGEVRIFKFTPFDKDVHLTSNGTWSNNMSNVLQCSQCGALWSFGPTVWEVSHNGVQLAKHNCTTLECAGFTEVMFNLDCATSFWSGMPVWPGGTFSDESSDVELNAQHNKVHSSPVLTQPVV